MEDPNSIGEIYLQKVKRKLFLITTVKLEISGDEVEKEKFEISKAQYNELKAAGIPEK